METPKILGMVVADGLEPQARRYPSAKLRTVLAHVHQSRRPADGRTVVWLRSGGTARVRCGDDFAVDGAALLGLQLGAGEVDDGLELRLAQLISERRHATPAGLDEVRLGGGR